MPNVFIPSVFILIFLAFAVFIVGRSIHYFLISSKYWIVAQATVIGTVEKSAGETTITCPKVRFTLNDELHECIAGGVFKLSDFKVGNKVSVLVNPQNTQEVRVTRRRM